MIDLPAYPTYSRTGIPEMPSLPTEWRSVRLKDLADPSHRYPLGDGDHGAISPSDYTGDGVPYLRVQNLGWDFDVIPRGLAYIPLAIHRANPKSRLVPNDIV